MKAEISPTQPAQSLETPKFTWVPFSAELAQRLLDFRSDRARLIAILQGIEAQGLPMALLGKWTSDIDPFTFLAAINRDLTPQNRKKIAMSIAEALELECPAPTDYDGIPVFSSLKARLVGDDSLECDKLRAELRLRLRAAARSTGQRTCPHAGRAELGLGFNAG
jgi:hypothetical protein